MPQGWTVEPLTETHSSIPYNPTIANAFYRAGYIESWGRSIQKVLESCKELGSPAPEYSVSGDGLTVKFTALASAVIPAGQSGGINGVNGGINGVDGGINGVNGGINGVDGGITGADGGINGVSGGINGVSGGINGADGGINGVSGGINGVRGGINGVNGGITDADGGINGVSGGINDVDGGINGVNGGDILANLTETERIVCLQVQQDGSLAAAPMSMKLGLTRRTVERILTRLRDKEIIMLSGSCCSLSEAADGTPVLL